MAQRPFRKRLQAALWTRARQDGFVGPGSTLHRITHPIVHVFNLESSDRKHRCYLNLGAHPGLTDDTMGREYRLVCMTVPYRRGSFEVVPGIHPGLVNVEAWAIDPEWPLPERETIEHGIPDNAYTGNVEIELTPEEARRFAAAILEAADAAERTTIFELDGSAT